MHYRVRHQIRYEYTSAVFLEPHLLRMRPRSDASQIITDYSLIVEPHPAGRHDYIDPEGNHATSLWFQDMTESLLLTASFDARTICPDPFGYYVTDQDFFDLPIRYDEADARLLARFLQSGTPELGVQDFADSVMTKTKHRTLEFLSRLCTEIYENFTVEVRHRGAPFMPALTLTNRRGACRDLAVLFMAACRSVGLAARFVSGYQEGDENMESAHLHAWAEVYVPGGGWRGYDPTHGLAVADRHIAMAAGHDPAGTLPAQGNFRGTGASAQMKYTISLTRLPDRERSS